MKLYKHYISQPNVLQIIRLSYILIFIMKITINIRRRILKNLQDVSIIKTILFAKLCLSVPNYLIFNISILRF